MSKTTKTNGLYVKLDDVIAILDSQYKKLCEFSCIEHDMGQSEYAERDNRAAYYTRCAAKQVKQLTAVDVAEVIAEVIGKRCEHHEDMRHEASMRAHKCEQNGEYMLAENLWESALRRKVVINELMHVQVKILDKLA